MVFRLVAIYLILLAVQGPGLCCCTAAVALRAAWESSSNGEGLSRTGGCSNCLAASARESESVSDERGYWHGETRPETQPGSSEGRGDGHKGRCGSWSLNDFMPLTKFLGEDIEVFATDLFVDRPSLFAGSSRAFCRPAFLFPAGRDRLIVYQIFRC